MAEALQTRLYMDMEEIGDQFLIIPYVEDNKKFQALAQTIERYVRADVANLLVRKASPIPSTFHKPLSLIDTYQSEEETTPEGVKDPQLRELLRIGNVSALQKVKFEKHREIFDPCSMSKKLPLQMAFEAGNVPLVKFLVGEGEVPQDLIPCCLTFLAWTDDSELFDLLITRKTKLTEVQEESFLSMCGGQKASNLLRKIIRKWLLEEG